MSKWCMILMMLSLTSYAGDVSKDGEWINIGVVNYIHIGTKGEFYMNGSNHDSCAGVRPTHFQVNMSNTYFKEFYGWILMMSQTKKPIQCVVASGCGTGNIWVEYCRGGL